MNTDFLNPYVHPWMAVNFFLALWALSICIRFSLESPLVCFVTRNIKANFAGLDEEKKRNTITYVAETLVTTFALVAQLYGGLHVVFQWSDETDPTKMEWMSLALQSVAILYVWEMIYRLKFDWPLLMHHLVTLLLIQMTTLSFQKNLRLTYIRAAIILGFHATTEQISFVALFCYRTKAVSHRTLSYLFYASSLLTFIFKMAATAAAFYVWAADMAQGLFDDDWGGLFWKIAFLPLTVGLTASQVYACRILYLIGKKVATTSAVSNSKPMQDATYCTHHTSVSELDIEEAQDIEV